MWHARVMFAFESFDDAPQHGGNDESGGDLLRARQFDPGFGREVGELYGAAAGIDGAQHGGDSGDVVRRHTDQRGLRSVRRHEIDATEDVRDEMFLPQHRRLRRSRRAAGE